MSKVHAEKAELAASITAPKKTVSTYGQMKVFWAKVFAQNERCTKAKRLTDAQINQKLRKAFPNKRSDSVMLISKVHSVHRAAYNAGCFHDGKVPKRQSHEYDEWGEQIVRRPGRKPGGKLRKEKGSVHGWGFLSDL